MIQGNGYVWGLSQLNIYWKYVYVYNTKFSEAVCHSMNKNFIQRAEQAAHKVILSVLLGQQTLPWRPVTIIAINLICPQDRLLKM